MVPSSLSGLGLTGYTSRQPKLQIIMIHRATQCVRGEKSNIQMRRIDELDSENFGANASSSAQYISFLITVQIPGFTLWSFDPLPDL